MVTLKESFEEHNLLLTASIKIPELFNHTKYNFEKLSKCLDFITFVHEYSRLMSTYKINDVQKSLELSNDQVKFERLLETGIPSSKVIFGVHLTGPGFSIASGVKDEDAIYKRIYEYTLVCNALSLKPQKWTKSYSKSGVPILRKTDPGLVILIENSRSIANKVRFAMKRGLGGISPTPITYDDFEGKCLKYIFDDTFDDFIPEDGIILSIPQRKGSTIPLLHVINQAMRVTLDEIKQEENLGKVSETTIGSTSTFSTISTTTQNPEEFTPSAGKQIFFIRNFKQKKSIYIAFLFLNLLPMG